MKRLFTMLSLLAIFSLGIFVFPIFFAHSAGSGVNHFAVVVSDSPRFSAKDSFRPGKDLIFLQLSSEGENKDNDRPDTLRLRLKANTTADIEDVVLVESGNNTGVFQSPQGMRLASGHAMINNIVLEVSPAEDTVMVIYAQDNSENVIASVRSANAVDRFNIIAGTIQTAGRPFSADVIAEDAGGSTLVAYTGKVRLEAEQVLAKNSQAKIFPEEISTFVNGKNSIFANYSDAGIIKIAAAGRDGKARGLSSEINFLPAKFELNIAAPQIAEKRFNVLIRALNFNNELTPGYSGTTYLKLAESGKIIKKDIRFKRGIAAADIKIDSCGEYEFIVCDADYPDVCGKSGSIFFRPDKLKLEVDFPPANRKSFYFDEVFNGRVIALGYSGKEVTGYRGAVRFDPIENMDMPDNYYFGRNDSGWHLFSVSGINRGPFRLKAQDVMFPELTAESRIITLMPAKIKTELAELKDNMAILHISIIDEKGRVVKEDNSTLVNVYLSESMPNRSAFVDGPKKIQIKNGEAAISVVDMEIEGVTVTVNSQDYYLGIEPLDITFE